MPGGNLTLIGAPANIVVSDIAARAGHPLSFGAFIRYAMPIAVITTALALGLYLLVFRLSEQG